MHFDALSLPGGDFEPDRVGNKYRKPQTFRKKRTSKECTVFPACLTAASTETNRMVDRIIQPCPAR